MMGKVLIKLHKYISLCLALFWAVQFLTGLILVFAPEFKDMRDPKPYGALDPLALERAIERASADNPEWAPKYIFTTSKQSTRFDVYFYHDQSSVIGSRAMRIDGDGEILGDYMMRRDFLNRVSELHEDLWLGSFGATILGLSGIFLFSNLILGFLIIWPQRVRWSEFFKISSSGNVRIKLYQWHRVIGLCAALPAVIIAFTGIMNIWFGDLKDIFGDPWPSPDVMAVSDIENRDILPLSKAMQIAQARYPDATFSIISLPGAEDPYYSIRMLQPGEIRDVFGNTKLFVDALDGTILLDHDQLNNSLKASLFSSVYALHLGNAIGMPGKILAFLTGISMMALLIIGVIMWQQKRSGRARRNA